MQIQAQYGVQTDYMTMLRNIMVNCSLLFYHFQKMQSPENALNVAKTIVSRDPNVNVHGIAELFLQFNRLQELTAFLVECMRQNRAEDGPW
jgi:clathrin heavy chain